jgi:hypothetical protein
MPAWDICINNQNNLPPCATYQTRHYPNPVHEIQTEAEGSDLGFIQTDFPKILDSMQMGTDRILRSSLSLQLSRMDESDFKAVDIHGN